MKKIISFILALLMLLLVSCSGKSNTEQQTIGWGQDSDEIDPLMGVSDQDYRQEQSRLLLELLSASEAKGMELSEEFSKAITKSAFDHFGQAIGDKKEDNVLISPLSIYIALAMTACGAGGETLSQMENVLGGLKIADAAKYLKVLSDEITENEKITLGLANSIWIRDNKSMIEVNESFLDIAKEYFSADIFKEKFDNKTLKDINAWIENKTNGMIREMLDKIDDTTVMYLINALVFEADWDEIYETSQLRESDFTSYSGKKTRTELMYSTEDYYLADEKATGFIKPYADSRYGFVALLPSSDMDIYEYASSLTGESFAALLKNREKANVNAAMPQFSYEYSDSLVEELKALGMTDAFSETFANLSGIGRSSWGNIYISDVLHKTFIEVSPKGTKAGAATVVIADCESAMIEVNVKTYDVILDRPFIYAITDLESGIPLFIGVLAELE
ncbi:MAG: serpin family protein [Clostridia bacterium]|nr:serpin family protein [Clostridia bacterium]